MKTRRLVFSILAISCLLLLLLVRYDNARSLLSFEDVSVPIKMQLKRRLQVLDSFENDSNFQSPVLFVRASLCIKSDGVCYRRFLMTTGDVGKDALYMPPASFSSCIFVEHHEKEYLIKFSQPKMNLIRSTEYNSDIDMSVYIRYEYKSLNESLKDPSKDLKISLIGNKTAFNKQMYFKSIEGIYNIYECFDRFWFKLHESAKYGVSAATSRYQLQAGCPLIPKRQVFNITELKDRSSKAFDVLFHGDSQPTYTCNQLHSYLNASNKDFTKLYYKYSKDVYISVYCNRHNGPITSGFDYYRELLVKFLKVGAGNTNNFKKYFINFSGLWDSSRGQMQILSTNVTKYHEKVALLLDTVLQFVKQRPEVEVFLMTTTLVQPLLYKGIWGDRHKYSMTQTRVEYINKVLIEKYRELASSEQMDRLRLVDVGQMSKVGENDPLSKNDMRHLGFTTNEKLINYLLCEAFG